MNSTRQFLALAITAALGAAIAGCNATFDTSGTLDVNGGNGKSGGSNTADSGSGGELDGSWLQGDADSSFPQSDAATGNDSSTPDASPDTGIDAAPPSPSDACSAACAAMKTSACTGFDESVCDGDCYQTGAPTTALTAFASCVKESGGLCTNSLSCWQSFQAALAN